MGRARKYEFIILKGKILTNLPNLNSELQGIYVTSSINILHLHLLFSIQRIPGFKATGDNTIKISHNYFFSLSHHANRTVSE